MALQLAEVMNQSLTPTKVDSKTPLSPSNYPDKRSVVAAYKRTVQMLLEKAEDRETLQRALKEFHGSFVVEDLMDSLRNILNEPRKRQLYLAIRPLIPSRQRPEYNSLIPHVPSFDKKVIHMKQQGNRSLGFTIRGGKEFNSGIYISSVLPSSRAAQCGLKAGDELVRLNGLTLRDSTHEEAVNLIKLKKTLTLTLREVGMVPDQKPGSFHITWRTVQDEASSKKKLSAVKLTHAPILKSTKRIQVMLDGTNVLGATIKTATDSQSGVFIVELIPNSVAHSAGLKVGDELIEANGHSLINVPHQEAIRMLKSSESLMLTIRVEERGKGGDPGHFDPLSNPPEDFELKPQDFDIDAELIPTNPDESTGFVLKPKDEDAARRAKLKAQEIQRNAKINRLSLLDMEMQASRNAPTIAAPAAFGYGPTMAMPTLMGMMPPAPAEGSDSQLDYSLISATSSFPEGQSGGVRQSTMLDMSNFSTQMPPSIASLFPREGEEEEEEEEEEEGERRGRLPQLQHVSAVAMAHAQLGQEQQQSKTMGPPVAPKPVSQDKTTANGEPRSPDHHAYQFPVEEEEEEVQKYKPSLTSQPTSSAMKKSPSDANVKGSKPKRTPAFKENVEIINVQEQIPAVTSTDNITVNPSNLEFSDEVLQGRRVAFHTVPKDGPLKIAIRGGTDTPLGGQIIISRILEGGAAERYGRVNVGDQILVCDGVVLINVTHNEAAQALKRAMDMESNSIDLVVAVNPDADGSQEQPKTMWPPQGDDDTVFDQHPTNSSTKFDYAKSAYRAHSGFTMRGKDKPAAHAFLPSVQ